MHSRLQTRVKIKTWYAVNKIPQFFVISKDIPHKTCRRQRAINKVMREENFSPGNFSLPFRGLKWWKVPFCIQIHLQNKTENFSVYKHSKKNFDWILTAFWLYFDCILTAFWLYFDWILTAFWLHFGCILTAFWLYFDGILTEL